MGDKRKSGVLLTEREMARRYPDSGMANTIYVADEASLRLPSENVALNYHMGGGIGYGKIVEGAGEESTGKTLMAINFAKVCQALGGIVIWDDAECSFDGAWFIKHGLDLSRIDLFQYENRIDVVSDWISDKILYWRSRLTKNEPILLVIDSMGVLETEEGMDTAEMDTKAEMGRRSYEFGRMLRKRQKLIAKYGICCFFINQLRVKIGAQKWEDPNTSPMEQPMKFYAAQRLRLMKGKKIRKDGAAKGPTVGNIIYIHTKKNKTAIPRDRIEAEVYFTEDRGNFGYHKYYGFDELLLTRRVVKKVGISYKFKGEVIAKGREKLKEVIATDAELRGRLIKKMGINTVSKTRKQIESIGHNMFPVKVIKKKDETEE